MVKKITRFRFNKMNEILRNHFFTGLLVITPLAVITWILSKVLSLLWSLQGVLPESLRPENLITNPALSLMLNLLFILVATFILIYGISILGWGSKQYLGQKALELIADMIQRIPILRSIYSALDQLLRAMNPGGGKGAAQFKRVVYIEWPRKGVWVLAFVTSPAKGRNLPEGFLNVFLPATPNPTSGFHLIIEEKEVRESFMTVEEAFRTILSLGIAQPATGKSP